MVVRFRVIEAIHESTSGDFINTKLLEDAPLSKKLPRRHMGLKKGWFCGFASLNYGLSMKECSWRRVAHLGYANPIVLCNGQRAMKVQALD